MFAYGGVIAFIIFLLILIACIILFLFYMNGWLCFNKLPRIWCFQDYYDELESIQSTEDECQESLNDKDDLESTKELLDDEDKETIAAEDKDMGGGTNQGDDDNRSDNSDEMITKFGIVVANFHYDMMNNTLTVVISNVEKIATQISGGPPLYQIFIKIIDADGRSLMKWHGPMFRAGKFKNPQTVEYTDMSAKDITSTAVRIRLYGCERRRRDKLLAESTIGLANVNLQKHGSYRIKLEQRAELKLLSSHEIKMDEENYFTSSKNQAVKIEEPIGDHPELLLGLGYNAVTGRLTVDIMKGHSFKNPLSRNQDKLPSTMVKITVCAQNNQVIWKSKTTVRYNQANPLFKEKFIFQIPQFQLTEISIIIGVYHKKSVHRKEIIGWFSVGANNSSKEEQSHWRNMLEACGDISCQWHLLQSESKTRRVMPGAN